MSVKIIYIMGYSRSGTTLMDTVLSNASGIVGVGELCNLVTAMDVRREYCACGELSIECPFWTKVRATWARNASGITSQEYLELQRFYTRYRRYWQRLSRSATRERFLADTRALYEAISEISGCSWIVDSSKNPIRALMLAQIPGIELYVVHLVRDIRGVTYSRAKSKVANPRAGVVETKIGLEPKRIAAQWMICNTLANGVRKRQGNRAILARYEDFIDDPLGIVNRISTLTGINLNELSDRLADGGDFTTGHTVAGNRLRMSGHIRLRRTIDWHGKIPRLHNYTLPLMTLPVAWRYGYRPI